MSSLASSRLLFHYDMIIIIIIIMHFECTPEMYTTVTSTNNDTNNGSILDQADKGVVMPA